MVTKRKQLVTDQNLVTVEIKLQAECFQWAWNTFPETRTLLFAVPNGGKRSKIEAMQLKASGVVPGIPDLLLIWDGIVTGFELKTTKGKTRDNQLDLHEIWRKNGIVVHIIRDFEDFKHKFVKIIR